jgi:hypothetical protein
MTRITQHDGPARARRAADAAAKPKYQRHPIQRRWCFGFAGRVVAPAKAGAAGVRLGYRCPSASSAAFRIRVIRG